MQKATLNKVPAITAGFWIIKILATTLGETGGDSLSMALHLGYLLSTFIFLGFFIVTLVAQVRSKQYHALSYWAVVVATTTVGTTTSDYLDRTLGLGYVKSSILLFLAVVACLTAWHFTTGSISVDRIVTRTNEIFYWVTILISNTLGTALGDFVATTTGVGFEGGALIFGALLAVVALLHFSTKISGSLLFWSAYVLTRPLGATLGDILTKPHAQGGLALSQIASSLTIAVAMAVGVILLTRRTRLAA